MEKTMNIQELLSALEKADNEIDGYEANQQEFLDLTQDKIDKYYYVQQKQEARVSELKSEADKLRSKAKVIENERKRMLEYLKYAMEQQKITTFPGKTYSVKIISRKKWVPTRPATIEDYIKNPKYIEVVSTYVDEPTPDIIDNLRLAGLQDIIETNFNWRDKTIKQEMKEKEPNEICQAITKYDVSSYVKFDVRKVDV